MEDQDQFRIIDEEIIRARVRQQIDPPKSESAWKKYSTHPLLTALWTFLLTGVVGASLAYYFNTEQKQAELKLNIELEEKKHLLERIDAQYNRSHDEIAKIQDRYYQEQQKGVDFQRQLLQKEQEQNRGFNNELSKTRVTKIAEIWEKIYAYEAEFQLANEAFKMDLIKNQVQPVAKSLDGINKEAGKVITMHDGVITRTETKEEHEKRTKSEDVRIIYEPSDGKPFYTIKELQVFDKSNSLPASLKADALRNKFWLGDYYDQIDQYIKATEDYTDALKEKLVFNLNLDNAVRSASFYSSKSRDVEARIANAFSKREKVRQPIIAIRNKLLAE